MLPTGTTPEHIQITVFLSLPPQEGHKSMSNNNIDASQFVKGKYLKGSDLDKRKPIRVTVQDIDQREFPEQGQKLVLAFLEIDQDMILNKTQAQTMIDMFGPQTALWRGQRLHLMQVASSYQGKPTIVISEGEASVPASLAPDSAEVVFGEN